MTGGRNELPLFQSMCADGISTHSDVNAKPALALTRFQEHTLLNWNGVSLWALRMWLSGNLEVQSN